MRYRGVWGPDGSDVCIEIDEDDQERILDITEAMAGAPDQAISDACVAYLTSDARNQWKKLLLRKTHQ